MTPQSPLFCKSQPTSPSHNLVIPLPIVSTRHFCCEKTINLASPGIRSRASAVGVGRLNHHAIIYCFMVNSRIDLLALVQFRTNLGHISLSSHYTKQLSLPHHAPTFSRIHPPGGLARHSWQNRPPSQPILFPSHGGFLAVR